MNTQHAMAGGAARLRLLMLLVLSLLLTACGDSPPRYQPLAQDSVVLAFGDSVTHGTGAVPVLVAVPEFSVFGASVGSLSDSPIYEELAEEERILLIDDIFSEVLSDEGLRSDRIHPNARGYRKMADGIAAALTEAGLKSQ